MSRYTAKIREYCIVYLSYSSFRLQAQREENDKGHVAPNPARQTSCKALWASFFLAYFAT